MLRLLLLTGFLILLLFFYKLLPPAPPEQPAVQQPALTAPLIRVTDPRQGKSNAPIVLFEFADFACEDCKTMHTTIKTVLQKFPDKILYVWKDFPLPIHPFAMSAHLAAACANDQGKFWEYHDRLFVRSTVAGTDYVTLARESNLDIPRFTECQNDATIQARISESFDEGRLLGVDQTPYLFVNGERLAGVVSEQELTKTIEKIIMKQ